MVRAGRGGEGERGGGGEEERGREGAAHLRPSFSSGSLSRSKT